MMVKKKIDSNHYDLPTYEFATYGVEVDVPQELIDRATRIHIEYEAMQDELAEIQRKAEDDERKPPGSYVNGRWTTAEGGPLPPSPF